jgi:signal transduction histidine kinase
MTKLLNPDRARIRVRARAVDMLGRQQIAGIPTAIHELFKNAHDAYADNVEVDYFREANVFVLRDDGIGMTREDFEQKWLTLGTESKVGANYSSGFIPTGQVKRPITGEKGIGRLAIATIGRLVLVFTRPLREVGLGDLTVAAIHWGIFEIPGIDLDEIIIPITTIKGGAFPSMDEFHALFETLRQNIEDLDGKISPELRELFYSDIAQVNFDVSEFARSLDGPSLFGTSHGTHFYIFASDPILQNDIDNGSEGEASNIEKMLLGFSNTMYSEIKPPMATIFRDHRTHSETVEILGGDAFFTPAEFEEADQHIRGEFDSFGQFSGFVSIYHGAKREHLVRWASGNGRKTECGPFSIRFAYLQGNLSDSLVAVDRHPELYAKTNKIGGLYIYKDGIRILPYGRADYDFLEMENRRSKSAKDAFFSYRRVYGAIEVNHNDNFNLIEKAGREGFRENRAYRQLRDILINFFKQLALDFFAPNASDNEFLTAKTEIQRQAALIKTREKQVAERKRMFVATLREFFGRLEDGYYVGMAEKIRASTKHKISLISDTPGLTNKDAALLLLETDAKRDVQNLLREISIARPRDIGFNKNVISDWDAYQKNRKRLEAELLNPLELELDSLISALNADENSGVDRRRRVAHQLEDGKKTALRRSSALKRELSDQIRLFQAELDGAVHEKLGSLNSTVEHVLIDFEKTSATTLNEDEFFDRQHQWEKSIGDALEETENYIVILRDRLKDLTQDLQNGATLDSETIGAIESQSEGFKDQLAIYFEFAQVGMALGIVQHEFSSTIKKIRKSIQRLKPWADGTPELNIVYNDIRNNFEHLDTYLNLFTPLSRRLYRKAKELSGYEILRYLEDVFSDRLKRHEITLRSSSSFNVYTIIAFPSTFLAVYVNILDNAIYWIEHSKAERREILLDCCPEGLVISNSGPGISHQDLDAIFEFGVTRKAGGRGMGLYISREALRRDGFDLLVKMAGQDVRPEFLIPIPDSLRYHQPTSPDRMLK